MRLTNEQIDAIKTAAREHFGSDAVIRLYGSRLSDLRRGGDVDLHVEISGTIPDYRAQSAFADKVAPSLDSRKVDVLFSRRGVQPSAFERIAYRDGCIL